MYVYIHIYAIAIPSSPPQDISVIPLSSTAFMVTWNISDLNYIYTVMWTNLNTSVMNDFKVQDSIYNSYNVTRLSNDTNYNVSVTAENMCGNNTSTPITVYGKY